MKVLWHTHIYIYIYIEYMKNKLIYEFIDEIPKILKGYGTIGIKYIVCLIYDYFYLPLIIEL